MKIIITIALIICAFVLSLMRTDSPLFVLFKEAMKHDKLIHCIGSQLLFGCCFWVKPSEKVAFCAVLSIGIVIEVCQHFTGRGFSVGDILADLVGVGLCIVLKRI